MGTKELARELFIRIGQRKLTAEEVAEIKAQLLQSYPGSSQEDLGMLFFAVLQEREFLIRQDIRDNLDEQRVELFHRFANQLLAA